MSSPANPRIARPRPLRPQKCRPKSRPRLRRPPQRRSPPDRGRADQGAALTAEARLSPYRSEHGPIIVAWLNTVGEAKAWAAVDRLPRLDDLARWHAEPDVFPFAWVDGDVLVGYGEVWKDREEDEAELARLVVAPANRGRGHGRALTRALADEAHRRGFEHVWLRVVPENAAARRAYEAAGFERATPQEEAAFNVGQRREYVWMRDAGSRRLPAI